jgi:hypothetical protein
MKRENLKWAIASVALSFGVGLFIGAAYTYEPRIKKTQSPMGNRIEYYLELQGDSAIVESRYGRVYKCHYDSIPSVLDRDNL